MKKRPAYRTFEKRPFTKKERDKVVRQVRNENSKKEVSPKETASI